MFCAAVFAVQVLPYEMLQSQLSISTVRDLEDFLITDCFYTGGGQKRGKRGGVAGKGTGGRRADAAAGSTGWWGLTECSVTRISAASGQPGGFPGRSNWTKQH
jgi:hypothetical protein